MDKRTELNADKASGSLLCVPQISNSEKFRLLAITPLERADLPLARTLARHDVAVALDIGRKPQEWPSLWAQIAQDRTSDLGLRIADGVDVSDLALPHNISFLIVDGDLSRLPADWRKLPVLAQVCSVAEAQAALLAGVSGLIAKGQESGGRIGSESSFVLLQRLLALVAAQSGEAVPVWCQGGIALNTTAGAFAGGAYGVVVDSILAAFPESSLPQELKTQVLNMDGSEAREVAGYHVYARGQREVAALENSDSAAVRAAIAAGSLLPLGQDAALSRLVLSECSNIEALVQTLRQRIAGQVQQAQTLRVLDENNAWARSHGTRYPIAQGPMTRVSDTAAFTASVANAGGLPFLALSLMREAACRELLEATVQQVGDKPWGVGLLGFGSPEILNPQLELVKEFKPTVLLLAGGRPSQARPFIEMGIPTYLHVPSPGLLDLFLKDGATHFVFEGRECGGHVGPRYSFVLWEQAIALLSQVENPEQLHVLFAGGIHDERSSAMVAAIAAPLAARGAKIGVLMGTAYIATAEAVSDGAVLESFQQSAIVGGETALVETAPGHAIRCLPSGFLDLFEREKARLQNDGIEQKEIWKQMEALTVGRLRIATKGVDYVDGKLSAISAETQAAEGMYMIGQIIAMKRAVITVAELHAKVTRGATDYIAKVQVPALQRARNSESIAIVGMACLYAGSPDLESYWSNILEGRDLVTEVPADRWSVEQYYRPTVTADKSISKWGGFINDTPFDPLKFGIPPASLAAIEPVQLLSLAVAQQAIDDAGYNSRWFDREKTSVIFGAEAGMDLGNQYTFRNLFSQYCGEIPEALAKALPSLTEDSFPGMLVNVISGRIANRLGLGGVNYSVTSACASSLTAIELGVKELRAGSSEMVLAGGADFHNGIADFLMFSSVGALSAKGRCRSFDNEADGIALGEGVGVVVLKRLSDAERDGDRIYAVIDGIAGSSDGKGLGLTAPRKEGQKRALERTYWQAGVLPGEVGLVEAHGTGTVVGDRTELKTLTEVYTAAGAVPGQAVLGSVKSQIGHSKCAAGIAGMIKIAKALHHRVLPPTGQITTPNAAYRVESNPFQLNRKPAPWLPHAAVARAAVSAFGFGGTNFHAVLGAYPAHQSAVGAAHLPAELFVVRAVSDADAQAMLRELAAFIDASDAPLNLRDLANTLWQMGDGAVQIAFVAEDLATLSKRIAAALLLGIADTNIHRRGESDSVGKVAFLFSGQGSQYTGMLRDLLVYFPPRAELLAAGRDELSRIYPSTAYDDATRKRQQQELTDTRITQPALGLVEQAAFEWLQRLGIQPDMAAGHSYGELVALATAGAFDASTLLTLSRARAEAIVSAISGGDNGAMAAVRLDVESLRPLLAGFPTVVMANQNSPIQTVISGPTVDVEAACAFLGQNNIGYKRIDTSCAFHSPLMAAGEANYAEALRGQVVGALQWPVYSNEHAEPYRNDAKDICASLARHIVSPVRFVAEIERMHADGARLFLEVGPRKVLTGLVGRILKDQTHTAIGLDPEDRGLAGLLETLAQLAVLLPNFDASALFAGRTQALDLSKPQKLSATTWLVNGGRAWPLKGNAPAYAAAVITQPVIHVAAALSTPASVAIAGVVAPAVITSGDQALVGYLANMRELVHAQRDVLLGYFGAPGAQVAVHASERSSVVATIAAAPTVLAVAPIAVVSEASVALNSQQVLLSIVSERTGYPAEMLDPDLDLEADLSIDSIKRQEIIGELSQRMSLRSAIGANADALLEQLTALKTLRAMSQWLTEKLPAPTASVLVAEVAKSERLETQVPALAAITVGPAAQPPVGQMLLDIISQSTGYPPESLDPDLDLEADLSIDSIKRQEVVGQLCTRIGVENGSDKDAMLEQLSSLKTLRAMTTWLEQRYAPAAAPVVTASAPTQSQSIPLGRYILRLKNAPAPKFVADALVGKKFLISDDRLGLAPRVAALLQARGVEVQIVDFPSAKALPSDLDQIDGLVHLWSLNPASRLRDVKRLFAVARDSLQKKGRHILVASTLRGDFGSANARSEFSYGAGLAGLVKTVVKEFPDLHARWVDFDLAESLDAIAGYIEQELLDQNPLPEVAYQAGQRFVREIVPTELTTGSLDGLPLTPESTVLLTGGARGITALIAIELARRYRCHLEIVGRSSMPTQEEQELTRGIDDPRKLRQTLLAADPKRKPAEIEVQTRGILADRAARETYAQVIAAGGSLNYVKLDVRDSKAFMHFIDSVYARRGRIDGVIHGAGVVEDKLVRDKTDESFGRVFDTKVSGAMVLNRRIRDDVKFVVFFSSVASAFGNRGQVDYASANDVLDKLAHSWQNRISGRVLSVNWGPWADTGMVSESLKNEYQRKGIGLIPQQEGVDALLRELSHLTGDAQILLMCGAPENFDGRSTQQPAEAAA
ncbi:type I polyketide synthase [Stenotrophobium rhamnosiphilum]|uniref:Uncharacterized protein n=1 Tax=Stenotrophobium rhamnosiphilum TaxID=2029166 RepID=A0A2T5MKB8_9GAMM|nr:type I polyketide synthase [Stenotrophobium rhamnosiphilum]PTU33008.1 hypothetical protein CJD38_02520 [Stenotrophobium rhamnosiphilum]